MKIHSSMFIRYNRSFPAGRTDYFCALSSGEQNVVNLGHIPTLYTSEACCRLRKWSSEFRRDWGTSLMYPGVLNNMYEQLSRKRFEEKENVSGVNNVKSSVQRGIRAAVLEEFPFVEDYVDQILPKKDAMKIVKCHEHIEIIASSSGEFLFFRQRDGPYYPTLKLLHKFPFILPHMQVDKGAIRFVLSGANIMCPGLTSPGARMTKVDKDQIVAIMAEGKENALAIGLTKMSSEEIYEKNKGIGVDNIHYLNDGLWNMKPVK